MEPEARVSRGTGPWCAAEGVFYRAIDPRYADQALNGSRNAGRFSPPDAPALYLSSSREGVEAAMIAHSGSRPVDLTTLAFAVRADRIADLRDTQRMHELGIDLEAAAAAWQEKVASGQRAASWKVREHLELLGARGLIDPSRKRPGLWHLTLFNWNADGSPAVKPLPAEEPVGLRKDPSAARPVQEP